MLIFDIVSESVADVIIADTRDDLYEDVKMADIMSGMYKNTTDEPPGLLQLCLDHRRENIARYLIKNGTDMWEEVTVRTPIISVTLELQ